MCPPWMGPCYFSSLSVLLASAGYSKSLLLEEWHLAFAGCFLLILSDVFISKLQADFQLSLLKANGTGVQWNWVNRTDSHRRLDITLRFISGLGWPSFYTVLQMLTEAGMRAQQHPRQRQKWVEGNWSLTSKAPLSGYTFLPPNIISTLKGIMQFYLDANIPKSSNFGPEWFDLFL